MRALWLTVLSIGIAVFGIGASGQTDEAVSFDIKSQGLVNALNEWAQTTGLQVVGLDPSIPDRVVPTLQGGFTSRAALARLLEGTTLTYQFVNERTVTIQERSPRMPIVLAAQQAPRIAAAGQTMSPSEHQRGTLEEVTVTAQKREQTVEDVPISMSVLQGAAIESAGISNITEMTYSVPGLSSVELGPGFQNITIRGIGNLRGTASMIGLYLDEAAVAGANEQQIDLRLFDLARVEVLRGPQGTLYGEGSMGGTIRYITNDPDLTRFGGNFDVSAFDTRQGGTSGAAKAVVNVPLVDGTFGIRIAARYEDTAGWIDQPSAHRKDINNSELKNIRVKSLWRLNEDLEIKATVISHRNEGDAYNYVNLGGNQDSNYLPPLDPAQVTPYKDDYEHYGLTVDYDLGFASVISASSYTDMSKFTLQGFFLHSPPAGSAPVGYREFADQDIRFFTQELRLISADDKKLKWTVGAFYRDANNASVVDYNFDGFRYGGDTAETSESMALFGDAEYALTDRLSMGVGGRYFEDRRSFADNLAGTTLRETFNTFSPRAYLSFAAADHLRVYASASKGFRSGGFNDQQAIVAGAPVGYEPEVLWSYELGTKMGLFDRRVAADFAVFYSDYENYVSTGVVPGSSIITNQTLNTGTARVRGVEWAISWSVLDDLRLGVNGSLVDAEIVRISALNTPSIVGDKLDNTPSEEYSAFADASFGWSESVRGFLRLSYSIQGRMYFYFRNGGLVDQLDTSDRVEFLDAHLGAQWNRWSAELFGTNLLDETGFVTPYTSFGSAAQARRRSIGVKVGMSF